MGKPNVEQKTYPEMLEQEFEGREEAVLLMEKLNQLQLKVGMKPDVKKSTAGSGLLGEISDIKSQLSSIMALAGLDGMRHNNLVFSDCYVAGRKGLNPAKLRIALASAGVDLSIINECFEKATTEGDGYIRRQLRDVSKPDGGYDI